MSGARITGIKRTVRGSLEGDFIGHLAVSVQCGMEIYTPVFAERLRQHHADFAKHHTCLEAENHTVCHRCECGTQWCDEDAS